LHPQPSSSLPPPERWPSLASLGKAPTRPQSLCPTPNRTRLHRRHQIGLQCLQLRLDRAVPPRHGNREVRPYHRCRRTLEEKEEEGGGGEGGALGKIIAKKGTGRTMPAPVTKNSTRHMVHYKSVGRSR
jgi:hypothetical protein